MRERKGKENRPQSNGGNGRVSDRLWRLYKEAAYQRYEEPPIDNPMAVAPALFKALQDYRTDFKVIDGLRTVVEHYGEYLISWFENIRKKWSESTPRTRVEAAELVWDAVAVVHHGSVPGDIEAFLSHYELPSCMEVDDNHFMERVPDDCCNCEYECRSKKKTVSMKPRIQITSHGSRLMVKVVSQKWTNHQGAGRKVGMNDLY